MGALIALVFCFTIRVDGAEIETTKVSIEHRGEDLQITELGSSSVVISTDKIFEDGYDG